MTDAQGFVEAERGATVAWLRGQADEMGLLVSHPDTDASHATRWAQVAMEFRIAADKLEARGSRSPLPHQQARARIEALEGAIREALGEAVLAMQPLAGMARMRGILREALEGKEASGD